MSLKEEDRNVLVTLELEKVKKTLAEMLGLSTARISEI